MASQKRTASQKYLWPWWRLVMAGLSLLALTLSIYLSLHYLSNGPVIGCSGGSSCDQVLSSRWSTIGGVLPVSGLAMSVYLAMLVAIFFIGSDTETSVRRLAWSAMLVLVGAAAGSAIWFIILQEWFIGAFCPYCMTAHITGLLLAALVIFQAPRQHDADASRPLINRNPAIGLALAGLALSAVVAVAQVAITPSAVYVDGESQNSVPAIDPYNVPLAGSPDAPYVVTLLFDYLCSHCQQLHFMIDEAVRRYDGKLAFVLTPFPLSSQCNPYVSGDVDSFNGSCDLARIGMAVWVADREAFTIFNRWMFSMDSGDYWLPRSPDAARAKAIELIGQEAFEKALTDPWIEQYIQNSVQTYASTGNIVPKLVYNSRWVVPEVYSVDDLVSILQNSLGVPGE